MSRRLGLIIGTNQYQDATFQPLQFAENDARALAQWLVNVKGGKWAPADVQLVLGEHATTELVESLLVQMCVTVAEPDDLVLIYFAGHTFVDESNGEGYLALANTFYQEPATGIYLPSLAQSILAHSRAAHLLFILDCFQTGRRWDTYRTSPYDFKPLLGPALMHISQQQGNRLFFCSCRGNAGAPEAGERSLGLFMYRMIVGLCGSASDPATGDIALQHLHAFLTRVLGEQQRPHLFGKEQYPLVLVGEMPLIGSHQAGAVGSSSTLPSGQYAQQHANDQSLASRANVAIADVQPSTTGQQLAAEQRQQQCSHLLSQAQQLLQMQNVTEALSIVEQALQVVPQDIAALTLKGQILGTLGRFPEALTVVEQLTQLDPKKALTWSMRAVVLTNLGHYQPALAAIERSLELDAHNPETQAIKRNILEQLATSTVQERSQTRQQADSLSKKRGGPLSFFIGVMLQIAGVVLGAVGGALLVLPNLPGITLPGPPVGVALGLESFGLALLCVNAARGAYRYGILRLLVVLLMCLVAAALLGAAYEIGHTRLMAGIIAHPPLLVPLLFAAVWLAVAATLPLILAIGGYIGGLVVRVRRRSS